MDEDWLLPPSLFDVPGVSTCLLARLFAAAAEFYRQAPWQLMIAETPLEVRVDPEPEARIVVIIGAAGEAFGLTVHEDHADFQRLYAATDPLELVQGASWLALSYEASRYLAQADRQAIARHGWQVAAQEAYPSIVRVGAPGPELHPPSLDDLYWLEAVLPALGAYFSQAAQGDDKARRFAHRANTGRGPVEVRMQALYAR